jgi:hypothetical protein
MTNYYADCGTSLSNVDAALQAYYGAGVTIHSSSATRLIFSCAAASDKVIELLISSSVPLAYYGDAYSAPNITNSVTWGGSSTTGTVSRIHLVLCTNTIVINSLISTQNSKIFIIGKLTNDAFAVAGMVANSGTTRADHYAKLTASGSNLRLFDLTLDVKSDTGKIYKRPLIIWTVVGGVPLTSGNPVAFRDLTSCSRQLGATTVFKGATYFITSSGHFFDSSEGVAATNSLLIESITLPA